MRWIVLGAILNHLLYLRLFGNFGIRQKRHIMNILRRIWLSRRYGTALYAVSGAVTLAAVILVISSPPLMSFCLILKCLSVPVILYLFHSFRKETSIYFYINLGISRNEFYLIPVVVEFVAFVLMMIIAVNIGYAIR